MYICVCVYIYTFYTYIYNIWYCLLLKDYKLLEDRRHTVLNSLFLPSSTKYKGMLAQLHSSHMLAK